MRRVKNFYLLFVVALIAMMGSVIASPDESPRMKCLKKCQEEHLRCVAAAKDDQAKKSACNKKLNEDLKLCPPPQNP